MGRDKNIGVRLGGCGGNYLYINFYTNPSPENKQKKLTAAVNNTVNKLILDRESCEKLHKKLRFADPVFIISGTVKRCAIKIIREKTCESSVTKIEVF